MDAYEVKLIEFIKNKKRMCNYYAEYEGCSDCKMFFTRNGTGMGCASFIFEYPEKAIAIVNEWIAEHPQKTFLSDFLEKHPNAPLHDSGTPIGVCPYHVGYGTVYACCLYGSCVDCWTRPLSDK